MTRHLIDCAKEAHAGSTKGPWREKGGLVVDCQGNMIFTGLGCDRDGTPFSEDTQAANARLTALSPNMAKALPLAWNMAEALNAILDDPKATHLSNSNLDQAWYSLAAFRGSLQVPRPTSSKVNCLHMAERFYSQSTGPAERTSNGRTLALFVAASFLWIGLITYTVMECRGALLMTE